MKPQHRVYEKWWGLCET